VKLAFHHTLFAWIPYFRATTLSWDQHKPGEDTRFNKQIDSFSFHCAMAGMLSPAIDIRKDGDDYALALQMTALWRRAAGLVVYGDYYPLTPFSKSGERWVAWQFDAPERGQGLLQGIRHADCPEESFTAYPQALRPDALYVLDNPETGETREIRGAVLISSGLTFGLPRRSGAIWFYREDQAATNAPSYR